MRRRLGLVAWTTVLLSISYSWCLVPTRLAPPQVRHAHYASTSARRSGLDLSSVSSTFQVELDLSEEQGELDRITLSLLDRKELGEWTPQRFDDVLTTMRAWFRWRNHKASTVIEHLLQRVVQEKVAGNEYAAELNMTTMYNLVVESWARSGHNGSPRRAEEILDNMQAWYEAGDVSVKPSIEVFNSVIHAYARSRSSDAPQQALRVFQKLQDLNTMGKTDVLPNTKSYAGVLLAHANSGGVDAPNLVKQMLHRLDSLSDGFFRPDYNCHNVYLSALVGIMHYDCVQEGEIAEKADAYLNEMLKSSDENERPDAWSFNIVLSAWSRSQAKDIAYRAEVLIATLEAYHEETGRSEKTQPNANTFNNLITCYSRSTRRDKAQKALAVLEKMKKLSKEGIEDARPDHITYNAVMNAYAKSSERDGPQKVQDLLWELHHLYDKTGDRCLKPSFRSFNTCAHAWARSNDPRAASRIMDWIKHMEANCEKRKGWVAPNIWTYNSYLAALSKTGRRTMGNEAEIFLVRMQDEYRRSGATRFKPDVHTFTNVINCIARSGADNAIDRAFAVLSKMEVLYANGYGDVRPNVHTYNCVINTVAKSKRLGKAKIAYQIVGEMKDAALKPHTITYNCVLNACAFSEVVGEDRREILSTALDALKDAQDTCGANFISYGTCLRVIALFEDDAFERWRLTRDTFRSCCKDGQLTKAVLEKLKFGITPRQHAMLIDEATDAKTGRLRDDYTKYARKKKIRPITKRLLN